MNLISTALISSVAAVGATYLLQALNTYRKGSEQVVEQALAASSDAKWTFVAMQYYLGVLNRTYLVFVDDGYIAGAKVKGAIASPKLRDPRWDNPLFYVAPKLASEYGAMDIASRAFLERCRENFRVRLSDIRRVDFTAAPKWGMGAVPYSGRVLLHPTDGKVVELILLGKRDGMSVVNRIRETIAAGRAKADVQPGRAG